MTIRNWKSTPTFRVSALAISLLFLQSCGNDDGESQPSASAPRGVVFLLLDTVRADRLSTYGHPLITTPNLDSMAKQGVVFEQAYAPAPWTIPSVASIFTGHYPSSHKAGAIAEEGAPRSLDTEGQTTNFRGYNNSVPSWIERLRDEGYRTYGFIANPLVSGLECYVQGFDEKKSGFEPADRVVDWAIDQIPDFEDEPFCLYLHFMDAHQPLKPPDELLRQFLPVGFPGRDDRGEIFSELKKSVREWSGFGGPKGMDRPGFELFRKAKFAAYDASIAFMDQEIHRLIQAMDAKGLNSENVLFVVVSDHGEALWDHVKISEETYDLGAMKKYGVGHGHTLFQEQIHVPLIFSGFGVPKGQRISSTVPLVDVGSTILDLAQLDGDLRNLGIGSSLRPYFDDPTAKGRRCFSEGIAYGYELRSMIDPSREKFIQAPYGDQKDLLFNLDLDPHEAENLLASSPLREKALNEQVDKLAESLSMISLKSGNTSTLDSEALKNLGYMENTTSDEDAKGDDSAEDEKSTKRESQSKNEGGDGL